MRLMVLVFAAFIAFSPSILEAGEMQEMKVVIASKTLQIGHVVAAGDVRVVKVRSKGPRDAVRLEDVVGKRVKRPVGKGNTVKRDYIGERLAIRKGDRVIIVVRNGNLRVSANGLARDDGATGDAVDVENLASGKVVSGIVVEPGVVEIYL